MMLLFDAMMKITSLRGLHPSIHLLYHLSYKGTWSLSQGASTIRRDTPWMRGTYTYTFTHPFIHFGHANESTMLVFGLGEDTRVPRGTNL